MRSESSSVAWRWAISKTLISYVASMRTLRKIPYVASMRSESSSVAWRWSILAAHKILIQMSLPLPQFVRFPLHPPFVRDLVAINFFKIKGNPGIVIILDLRVVRCKWDFQRFKDDLAKLFS